MPHAFLLHLAPQTPTANPAYPHHYAHGLFYHLLEQIDPNVSARIHGLKRNPFTLWAKAQRDGSLMLRVTILDDDLFRPLLSVVLQESLSGLELGQDRYRVARVLATPEGHRDADADAWEGVLCAEPRRTLELRFLTPTVFATSKGGDRRLYTPLPLPKLILKSLLTAFQAYSPVPYSEPEAAGLELAFDEVVVTSYDIETRPHRAGKAKLTGFVGRATLRSTSPAEPVARVLGQLGKLSFYSGIGAKTPYGMGQVRAINRANRKRSSPRAPGVATN